MGGERATGTGAKVVEAKEHSFADEPAGWNRRAAYICMMPRKWQEETVYSKKIQAYLDGLGTSHWAVFCDVKRKPRWPRENQPPQPTPF